MQMRLFMCAGLWLRMGKIPQSTSDTDPRILNACWMNSLKVKPGMIQSDKRAFSLIGNLDTSLTSYTHIDFLARVCTILSSIYVISKCLRKAIPQFLVHSNLNINLLTQGQFSQLFFFSKNSFLKGFGLKHNYITPCSKLNVFFFFPDLNLDLLISITRGQTKWAFFFKKKRKLMHIYV